MEEVAERGYAVTFDVPPHLAQAYRFLAGQHVSVVGEDGKRRPFSIASSPSSGVLRIGVRHLPDGAFSQQVATGLRPGDELEVMTPAGRFVAVPDPDRAASYVAVAAGSGVTPVLAVVSALLEGEPGSVVTALLADRSGGSAMFTDDLHALKDRFPTRLQLVHVLSREEQEAQLLSGRLDGSRLRRILAAFVDVPAVDDWYLCGPQEMVAELRDVLLDLGVSRVHTELFHVNPRPSGAAAPTVVAGTAPTPGPQARPEARPRDGIRLDLRLDGRTATVDAGPGETVLEAALRARPDLPYACRGGVCGTCRARVEQGTVQMAVNYALEADELEAGYVLTCQAVPTTSSVTVDYDA